MTLEVQKLDTEMLTIIMLTRPCNVDSRTSYFYIVKTGIYRGIHFLIFALKLRLWVLVRTAPCCEQNYEK